MTLEQIAADFGIHVMTLSGWLRKADVEDGVKPGATSVQLAELREARRHPHVGQENEVLRRAVAYLSQANLPGSPGK